VQGFKADATMRIITLLLLFATIVQIDRADAEIRINSQALTDKGHLLSNVVVYYVITNSHGQRLGYDPRKQQGYTEIEGSYGITDANDIPGIKSSIKPNNGNHLIELIGDTLMVFGLDVSMLQNINGKDIKNFDFEGIVDNGLTSKFQVVYSQDPVHPSLTVRRFATPLSLKQDIALSYRVGWIENGEIMASLLKRVDVIEAAIVLQHSDTAKNQLAAFVNDVNTQNGKCIKDEAAKILLEDAQYIIEHLEEELW